MKRFIIVLVLLITYSSLTPAQEIGKIIPIQNAEQLFGKVTEEISIPLEQLKGYIAQSKTSVSFNIINRQLHVLGDGRKAITSVSVDLGSRVQVHLFSKSIIEKFISITETRKLSTATTKIIILVQLRGDILTISNGTDILEYSQLCPPYCG